VRYRGTPGFSQMNGPFIWLLPAGWAIHLVQHCSGSGAAL
jgi:hypothetical protein